jgi:hypothetical protein
MQQRRNLRAQKYLAPGTAEWGQKATVVPAGPRCLPMSASHVKGGRRLLGKLTVCGREFLSLNNLSFYYPLLNCVILLPQISELSKQAYRRDRGYVSVSLSADDGYRGFPSSVRYDSSCYNMQVKRGLISVWRLKY